MFVGILLRDPASDFSEEFESLRHREIRELIFVLLYHFACNILHTVIRKILFYRSGVFTSDCQVFKVFFSTF